MYRARASHVTLIPMLHNMDCMYFMSNIVCPCIHAWHVYDAYVSIAFSVRVEHNMKCISARNTAIQGTLPFKSLAQEATPWRNKWTLLYYC